MILIRKFRLKEDQRGMASFIITMVMTIVVTLIVVGFSQVSHNEEQSSLNRDLSTQAFYAAESGINDAVNALQGYLAENATSSTIISPPNKTICGDTNNSSDPTVQTDYSTLSGVVKSNLKVSYPCLIISTNPKSLSYTGTSKVVNIQTTPGSIMETITLNWQNDTPGNVFGGCTVNSSLNPNGELIFPPSWPNNCDADVLQVDLVPAVALTCSPVTPCAGGVVSPEVALNQETFTTFLYPSLSSSNTVFDNPSNEGKVQLSQCNGQGCTAIINVGSLDQGQYYMRFNAMYGTPQNVTITAVDGSGTVSFINGQAIIDSTGLADGVLRRIEVRTPINSLNNGLFPNAALQVDQTLCKKFYVTPEAAPNNNSANPNPGSIINANPSICTTS